MFQGGNYAFVQNTSNRINIFKESFINYTIDSAFKTSWAISGFAYLGFNFINYLNKTLSFYVNGNSYVVNETLLFPQNYNLTTIVLSNNSFAY